MAQKAKFPITITTLDYEKKEMGVKSIIYDTSDFNTDWLKSRLFMKVKGKNPEQFAIHSE